ncbi:MAG: site-specific DNA-methyltransferase [Clostridia bacterium]|nr:site-specific DNA-methyltransferase [Clostridia bacterium]
MAAKPVRCDKTQWLGLPSAGTLLLEEMPQGAGRLLSRYAGQVQTLYLDPPFNTGKVFEVKLAAGEADWKTGKGSVTGIAYDDRWPDRESYLSMMRGTLETCRELLCREGTVFLHADSRMIAPLRLMMDEIFGESCFLNEIIWAYQSGGRSRAFFPRKHDTILFYARSRQYYFNLKAVPVGTGAGRSNHMRRQVDEEGRAYRAITSGGKEYRYYDDDPVYPSDVWSDIPHLQQRDPERTGFETQKPAALMRRILACASREGDLVGDLFAGSGTTAAVAAQMGRRFICTDRSALSLALAERRLDALPGMPPEHGYTVEAPCFTEGASAEAVFTPAIASYSVFLRGYESDEARAAGLPGMDTIERWSCGFLRGGVYTCCQSSARSRRHPALSPMLEMPVYAGEPCVQIVDIWGNRRFFLPERSL